MTKRNEAKEKEREDRARRPATPRKEPKTKEKITPRRKMSRGNSPSVKTNQPVRFKFKKGPCSNSSCNSWHSLECTHFQSKERGDKCVFVHAGKTSDDKTPKSGKGAIVLRLKTEESRVMFEERWIYDNVAINSERKLVNVLPETFQNSILSNCRKVHSRQAEQQGRRWGLSRQAPSQNAIPMHHCYRNSLKSGLNTVQNHRDFGSLEACHVFTTSVESTW